MTLADFNIFSVSSKIQPVQCPSIRPSVHNSTHWGIDWYMFQGHQTSKSRSRGSVLWKWPFFLVASPGGYMRLQMVTVRKCLVTVVVTVKICEVISIFFRLVVCIQTALFSLSNILWATSRQSRFFLAPSALECQCYEAADLWIYLPKLYAYWYAFTSS